MMRIEMQNFQFLAYI